METRQAVESLAALAQETRLELYRRLVQGGREGVAAGEIAESLAIPKPTLSFHLAHLERAGLVTARRVGRQIFYAPDFGAVTRLVAYLYENCCSQAGCAGVTQSKTSRPVSIGRVNSQKSEKGEKK